MYAHPHSHSHPQAFSAFRSQSSLNLTSSHSHSHQHPHPPSTSLTHCDTHPHPLHLPNPHPSPSPPVYPCLPPPTHDLTLNLPRPHLQPLLLYHYQRPLSPLPSPPPLPLPPPPTAALRAAGRLTLLRTTSSRVVTIGEYFEEATVGLRSSCMCISNIHARPNAPSVTSCLRALTSQHSTDHLKSTLSLPLLVRSFPL